MCIPDCEMARSMNDEVMEMKIDDSLCAVSGCKNKYIKIVYAGNCGVPLCKEHLKNW